MGLTDCPAWLGRQDNWAMYWIPGNYGIGALFHIEQKAFEVFPFRMIDVHGVVAWLVQTV